MAGDVRAGAGLAGLAFLAGCQLILDFPALEEAGPADASTVDGGAPDAQDLCGFLEPNNLLEEAGSILPGTFRAAVCPAGDVDFYQFTLDGAEDLVVEVFFQAGANDLELELLDATSGEVLTVSTGGDGDEKIERSQAQFNRLEEGTYALRIFGRDAEVQNDYDVMWRRGPAAPPADAAP
jgi:Bacterial pre-peptidase C-terminal domain